MKDLYAVKYNSEDGNRFVVEKPMRGVWFVRSPSRLYYHNILDRGTMLVNTVASKREGYTHRKYSEAEEARSAFGLVGYPSDCDFQNIVRAKLICNYPNMCSAINTANNLFGPDIPSLKGKSVR